jgi:hypothetical protein
MEYRPMTRFPEIMQALAAPFEPHQVRERKGQRGEMLKFITAPTAMNRLDEVLGPEGWSDSTGPVPDGSGNYSCRLTVTWPDGSKTTKSGIGAPGEGTSTNPGKAAASDAFKRAAARYGVARYLAKDGGPRVPHAAPPPRQDPTPEPQPHVKERDQWGPARPPQDRQGAQAGRDKGPPRNGAALFGRLKDYEKSHGEGLLKYLQGWAKLQEFPGRMVDWDGPMVELAYGEAQRKIREYERSDEVTEALAN